MKIKYESLIKAMDEGEKKTAILK
ncbi:hypothetical protein [Bacillus wiedmannii]